jgi:Uma2 family endonuclease
MAMPAPAHYWTPLDVLALMDENPLQTPRYEVVDGELFVTPSPGPRHQLGVTWLLYLLISYLNREPIGEAVTSPSDVQLEPDALVQPDVYVVAPDEVMRMLRENNTRSLLLAIEVISPGSQRGDRGRKRKLYQRRVPLYWIFDMDARHVEQWRPDDAHATTLTDRIEWHPVGARAPFVPELPAFFAKVLHDQV